MCLILCSCTIVVDFGLLVCFVFSSVFVVSFALFARVCIWLDCFGGFLCCLLFIA